jgi:protein-tyrosine phosphatase
MKTWIACNFGTWRGLIRLLLAYIEFMAGRLWAFRLHRRADVQRVVFVCLGNICRSTYAHSIATKLDMNAASCGLSATTGNSSPAEAIASARRHGIDLTIHRALNWSDFQVQSGDLFLAMEIRQARALRRHLGNQQNVQICLLGMWCNPIIPHLHDPFMLSDEYFDTCFRRIEQAVRNLSAILPSVRR